ncbi:hypothetical protein DH2020_019421 [Rehmannia glutinosa]|uniref:Uncharacterized protein n=1 Tax=Rehmannia glutinosa TaxID=99300 RepID=A0ABR0WN28_REHGL
MAGVQSTMSLTKKLDGKVAVITGGASGIGEATARHFADHGARAVVIVDINAEKARSVPNRSAYTAAAISNATSPTRNKLDIMFSNAGIASDSEQTILDLDLSQYDTLMRINVRSMAVCVKHAARKMVELGIRGAIVCTGSVATKIGGPNRTDCTMSKHAVLGLVRSASLQLGQYGIRVNCVSPSAVATPLAGKVGLPTAGDVENVLGPFISLKGVMLTLEHVAAAVLFLASDESGFVTGHNLVVDGGLISLPYLKS